MGRLINAMGGGHWYGDTRIVAIFLIPHPSCSAFWLLEIWSQVSSSQNRLLGGWEWEKNLGPSAHHTGRLLETSCVPCACWVPLNTGVPIDFSGTSQTAYQHPPLKWMETAIQVGEAGVLKSSHSWNWFLNQVACLKQWQKIRTVLLPLELCGNRSFNDFFLQL